MVGQVGLLYMRLNVSKIHVSLHVTAEQRLPQTVLPSFNHSYIFIVCIYLCSCFFYHASSWFSLNDFYWFYLNHVLRDCKPAALILLLAFPDLVGALSKHWGWTNRNAWFLVPRCPCWYSSSYYFELDPFLVQLDKHLSGLGIQKYLIFIKPKKQRVQ